MVWSVQSVTFVKLFFILKTSLTCAAAVVRISTLYKEPSKKVAYGKNGQTIANSQILTKDLRSPCLRTSADISSTSSMLMVFKFGKPSESMLIPLWIK